PAEAGAGGRDEQQDDPAVAPNRSHPAGRGLADDHLVPPDLAQVVDAGPRPGPLETVAPLLPARHGPELLRRVRVPHEVVALTHCVGVVDAVVAENPALVDVPAGKHGGPSDDGAEALALE